MRPLHRSLLIFGFLTALAWPWAVTSVTLAFQIEPPLKLNQIERLLDIKFEDGLLAREITRRGVAFRLDERTLERLQKRGLAEQSRRALNQQEELLAYNAFANAADDPAKRLLLGKAFLQHHSQSLRASEVVAEVSRLEVEAFKSNFQLFNKTPDIAKLQQLLQAGQILLKQSPNVATTMTVTTLLALATAQGALEDFYQELEQSQVLVGQAIRLLINDVAANGNRELQQELSARALGELQRAQALFLLRQTTPDPEQALQVLDSAVQAAPLTVGKEARTFWLQALARELIYQRQLNALILQSPNVAERQVVCLRIEALRIKLVEDYTRVIALSAEPKEHALRDEANVALKKLVNSAPPCAETNLGASTLPAPTAQRARKVTDTGPKLRTIFIRSKTVYLKPNQLEAALLKHPDFHAGEWRILRNEREADLVMEISLPFLSWNWTFELTQRSSGALLGAGKVREATAGTAVPRLVEEFLLVLKQIRRQEQAERQKK